MGPGVVKTFQVSDPAQQKNQIGFEFVLMVLGAESL
jgi:hypothetical protein